jgi:RNA polymerase, sigma 27/28 subunit, RpsK/SigK
LTILAWLLAGAALLKGTLVLMGYLNHQIFPQPLDEESEKLWLDRMEKGSDEARNKLIEHNLRLVAHVVRKYESSGEDMEDLISIGTIGLIKAIRTFKNERGVRLATYAARCIENEVLMHLRNIKKMRQEVYMYDPIGYDKEGNEISLIDILTTDNEIVDIVEMKMQDEKNAQQDRSAQPPRATGDRNALRPVQRAERNSAGDRAKTGHLPLLCLADRKAGLKKADQGDRSGDLEGSTHGIMYLLVVCNT